ncbi:MAG TPA: POTRA domain-containing protein [Pyrinomonadaceae bacterium]|nr:POTRA domain-containing protein [Pyrinomonadaceae bacterium]
MQRHVKYLAAVSLLFVACFVFPSFNTQAQRSTPLVESVEVVGNRRLTVKEILSHVKTQPGEPFTEEQAKGDLQDLLSLGVFDKLATRVVSESGRRGGVVVIFEVVELPLLLDVKFGELRAIDESEVLRRLREHDIHLVKGAVYDVLKVRTAVRVLQKLLASRGWPNAIVTVESAIGGTYASVEFEIRYDE